MLLLHVFTFNPLSSNCCLSIITLICSELDEELKLRFPKAQDINLASFQGQTPPTSTAKNVITHSPKAQRWVTTTTFNKQKLSTLVFAQIKQTGFTIPSVFESSLCLRKVFNYYFLGNFLLCCTSFTEVRGHTVSYQRSPTTGNSLIYFFKLLIQKLMLFHHTQDSCVLVFSKVTCC